MSALLPFSIVATITAIDVELASMPRTHITVSTPGGASFVVTVPGSNGPPVRIGGLPQMAVGDTWQMTLDRTPAGFVPVGLGAGLEAIAVGAAPPYNLNGLHYEPDALPLPFWLNQDAIGDLGVDATEAVVLKALDAWSSVGCSTFQFAYQGLTEARYADDGLNVLSWEDEVWEWGGSVAGFTATRFGQNQKGEVVPVGADIVFNAVDWVWVDEPGDAYARPATLNADSVVLHELGHVTGMDHEYAQVTSTMFFAYIGGDWQGSLSGDDRRGLCENYPSGSDECSEDADCQAIDDQSRHCVQVEGISVCEEVRDAVGASCSRTNFNCEQYCIFTNNTATDGYCSIGCDDSADCPSDTHCATAPSFLYDDPDVDERLCVMGEALDTATDTQDTAPSTSPKEKAGGCQSVPTAPFWWLGLVMLGWRRQGLRHKETT